MKFLEALGQNCNVHRTLDRNNRLNERRKIRSTPVVDQALTLVAPTVSSEPFVGNPRLVT